MRAITAADYLVEALIANGVSDVFGYQGGMIAYVFDSLGRYRDSISYHSCGSEQGAAFAACAYAQATDGLGVAISTSGPGFTNLLTGVANAWFDSVPVLFVSGNVNTKDKLRDNPFRQNGFQEIQASKMAAPVTKKSVEVELDTAFAACLDDAIETAMSGRMGPVYLDLPINICRETVEFDGIAAFERAPMGRCDVSFVVDALSEAKRPVIIAGAGIAQAGCRDRFRELVHVLGVPVVTTMPGIGLLPSDDQLMLGYIGGTARREAGIALQNADFVLSLGARLCSKQVGHNMTLFAPMAERFIRVDIDEAEFAHQLKDCEQDVLADLRSFIPSLLACMREDDCERRHGDWVRRCSEMRCLLAECDMTSANTMFRDITQMLPDNANVILDVGKNLNYACQSAIVKNGMELFMSAGLGAMGYAIPAAIGAFYGNGHPTYAFTGDGGAQMNIQELNTIAKNGLPVKTFVMNNRALGNILLFQDSYLGARHVATSESEGDYFSCDFTAIAEAYGMEGVKLYGIDGLVDYADLLTNDEPVLFEICYEDCPSMPGIVAGGKYLAEGTGLGLDVITQVKEIMGVKA